jgi:hypothetical protein
LRSQLAQAKDHLKPLTSGVCLPSWNRDACLEPEYVRILEAIVEHTPQAKYSVVLHGSALWGDRTILRSSIPISDVDVLVVGDELSDLRAAAVALRAIAEKWGVGAVPLFKLSVKFRTSREIATEELSANELGALLHGCVLVGPSRFEVLKPDALWFYAQANLALRTRLLYVAQQQKDIASSQHRCALSRYLAARLLLDIPTTGLVLKGIVGLSYRHRVANFLSEYIEVWPHETMRELEGILTRALLTKQDPESNDCMDISTAAGLLVHFGEMFGLKDSNPGDNSRFWVESRPLDLRDRTLWKNSRG